MFKDRKCGESNAAQLGDRPLSTSLTFTRSALGQDTRRSASWHGANGGNRPFADPGRSALWAPHGRLSQPTSTKAQMINGFSLWLGEKRG
jgi:hypothetical protein